jgi:hypothetical protein
VFLCAGLNLQLEAELGEKLSPPLKQYIQDLLKVSLFVVLLLIYVNSNLDLCVQLGFNCYFKLLKFAVNCVKSVSALHHQLCFYGEEAQGGAAWLQFLLRFLNFAVDDVKSVSALV